jgi:hypothetical protein
MRVKSLYGTLFLNDLASAYGFIVRTESGYPTLEDFVTQFTQGRGLGITEWRIRRVVVFSRGDHSWSQADLAAHVVVNLTVRDQSGLFAVRDDRNEFWIRVEGKWRWLWLGWESNSVAEEA